MLLHVSPVMCLLGMPGVLEENICMKIILLKIEMPCRIASFMCQDVDNAMALTLTLEGRAVRVPLRARAY